MSGEQTAKGAHLGDLRLKINTAISTAGRYQRQRVKRGRGHWKTEEARLESVRAFDAVREHLAGLENPEAAVAAAKARANLAAIRNGDWKG